MIDRNNLAALIGATVVDRNGEKIGTLGQIYVHPQTQDAKWASIKTGLFSGHDRFVPLGGADTVDGDVHLDFDKSFVKHSPSVETDGPLTENQETELHAYYVSNDTSESRVREPRHAAREQTSDEE